MVRAAIERLYKGKCTIAEFQPVKDPVTKVTSKQEVNVLTDQPCRLSFKNISSTSAGDAATVNQIVTLFIAPEIVIKAGSKITVTQNGVTTAYTRSGQPAVYSNHQEVILQLFKGWA